VKGKRSLKFTAGIIVIILTTLMLVTIPLWTNRWSHIDFPCEWFGAPPNLAKVKSNSRIAYCISVYPRNAYGGAPLAYGSAEEENVSIKINDYLDLRRQGNILFANNHVLRAGEINKQHIASFTLNPWLFAITDLSVKNEGMLKSTNSESFASDVIFISGDSKEGWELTPFGFLFFGIGLGLLILDAIVRRKKSKA
jgi:hypothetical protein